ncbi:7-deoxyloganetic acid glucosyl transferase-like [Nicotiana tomentosiformis]|uniref:7-deoxyloganetic acid glucosyl transferase-like n=1 Tax=Nicotiana tomentosiformis TaxID=4098 RepID=UPI00051B3FEC|nr:7-deoxyloganetic acid glucosyl transferase-like [Nicotiana tomentosiformis]
MMLISTNLPNISFPLITQVSQKKTINLRSKYSTNQTTILPFFHQKMDQESLPPHVLIFPLPLQGPVNSTFKLAELLCISGLHITFLLTENIHNRLVSHTNISSRFERFPGFQIKTISDGLPQDHPRKGSKYMELFDSLKCKTKPLFKDMLTSGWLSSDGKRRPVSCIIADGVLGFTCDVANEIGIPIFSIRTISPCCLWIFFCLPQLIESGEYPFKGDDLDEPIKSVPGAETFLRRRDLPDFCRTGDLTDSNVQLYKTEGQENSRAYGLILNTFEELDGHLLSQMRTVCPNIYPIGPLHAHLKKKLSEENNSLPPSSNSLFEEDKSCINWLNNQLPNSVIYVSFGSIATMTKEQLMEFWYGLVNSKQNFLWVIRLDSVAGDDWKNKIPLELVEGTKERGYIVGWAPQEEVLAHPSVGGFWTHCGWNSILETVYEGKPMICWPYFMDQQVNSRFVEAAWKLGLDMKDTCDRKIVEKMVKDLMVVKKEEFLERANQMSNFAKKCLKEGGSSYSNFERLVNDIKSFK